MAFSSEIVAKLGLNTSGFTSGLANASSSLQNWSGGMQKEVGALTRSVGTLRNLFMVGGLLGAARAFFGEAIDLARNYKGALDENIEATKRFDVKMQELGSTFAKAGVWLVGTVEKGAIGLASLVYGADAAADAFDRMNKAAAAALDDERAKKLAEAQERLGKVTRDIQFSETDNWGKLVILINEVNDLKDQQRKLDKGSAEWLDAQTKIEQNLAAQRKVNAEIRKQQIEDSRNAEAKAADETKAAEEARLLRLQQLREAREALVAAAEREAAIAAKVEAIRTSKGKGPAGVDADRLDFDVRTYKQDVYGTDAAGKTIVVHRAGEPMLDANGNPIIDSIRAKAGGIGPGASFDRGAMFLMGGETTFKNPAQQVIYEQQLRANTLEKIDRLIADLEGKIYEQTQRMAFGGQTRNYMIDVWRQDVDALRNRRSNVDRYLFDPTYADRLGRSIPGEQIAVAGGALEDYAKKTADDIAAVRRLFETGMARTASIVVNADAIRGNPRG